MPPHKPSPHRFIAPAPAAQTPNPKPKPKPRPPSTLRHARSAQPGVLQVKKIAPAKRFVLAPTQQHGREREGDGAAPRADRVADRVESPPSSVPGHDVTPRPRAGRLASVESIEEPASSASRAVDENEEGDGRNVVQTIEHGDDEDEDEMLFETPRASKRRRTSPPSPTTHRAALGAGSHRFRVPQTPAASLAAAASNAPATPAAASVSVNTNTTTASRPHFLIPAPRSPDKPCVPLPEIFSPSRKAQKYIPAGLASSVQAWIIEAAQQGPGAGIVWGREREDGVRIKIKVSDLGEREEVECWPGGTTFLLGETEPGMYNASRAEGLGEDQGIRLLLAGHGGLRGAAGVKIRVGSVIGVREPTWELDVGGEKWTVGVDWLVLH
ncbi:hypothetical protein E8E12_003045 [Didymella heteroderae]|uniref:Uncharacterized protein n=1 Tax=Didymella heteroderae TaxID=1769908 RepID=A0A9P4WKL5_9PLEO|nr:hypothetical protein E8E12_003045 [Didymella heteroderae]